MKSKEMNFFFVEDRSRSDRDNVLINQLKTTNVLPLKRNNQKQNSREVKRNHFFLQNEVLQLDEIFLGNLS